ncbi:MAG: hypothetical protein H7177_09940 [Rhizobacter sp.]|nr:hypothetical protein [Bacteriovorax sp.]
MKTLAALLLLTISASASAYVPLYDVQRVDGAVQLTITNDNENVQICHYKFSWFEGLNYKRFNGKIALLPDETKVFEIKNDRAARVMHLTADVECE